MGREYQPLSLQCTVPCSAVPSCEALIPKFHYPMSAACTPDMWQFLSCLHGIQSVKWLQKEEEPLTLSNAFNLGAVQALYNIHHNPASGSQKELHDALLQAEHILRGVIHTETLVPLIGEAARRLPPIQRPQPLTGKALHFHNNLAKIMMIMEQEGAQPQQESYEAYLRAYLKRQGVTGTDDMDECSLMYPCHSPVT